MGVVGMGGAYGHECVNPDLLLVYRVLHCVTLCNAARSPSLSCDQK